MATPGEKLAESLEKLKEIQDKGIVGIKANDLSRVHRERLVDKGFIREVLKGWYISSPHDEQQGDSTSWYVSFWGFCARYLDDRYGEDYCISAEQSLMLHAGNNTVPTQLIIRSAKGNNLPTELLFGTSLFAMKSPLPDKAEIEIREGVRIVNLPSSLVHCSPSFYIKQATDARAALMMIKDSSELLSILLDGGHSKIAGRLAGAYRNIGRDKIAEDILKTMKSAGYDVRESDPFEEVTPVKFDFREQSPYVNRIKLMWHKMREEVIKVFPDAPGIPNDKEAYLEQIEELYTTDAYHSLSIEKYVVTPALIERVRSGQWDAEENEEDKQQKDAMAARGYWQAFKAVKLSIGKILDGKNAGKVVDADHGDWYRELFGPSVSIGLLKPSDLAGYRNRQVFIGQSKHTPINKDGVRDVMPLLFELLEEEGHPGVRAVLGHFIFVYTHPYSDGNGRMGRFLMNSMLSSGGYPWTVVPLEERDKYMSALESASVDQDIKPFAEFISWLVNAGIDGNPIAKKIESTTLREEVILQSEFPPYEFYQDDTKYKYKTWRVDLRDQGFTKIRLNNIELEPIRTKERIRLLINIESKGTKTIHQFNLNELFVNPVFERFLFFVEDEKDHVSIDIPSNVTHVTYELELPSEVENFRMQLNCEYLNQ